MSVKNIVIERGVANLLLTVEETMDFAMSMTRTFPRTSRGSEPLVLTDVLRITEPANRFKEKASKK